MTESRTMATLLERPGQVENLLERKIDICFGHVDVDGDGYFEGTDAMAMAAKMIAYQGESFESPKAKKLLRVMGEFMNHVGQDLDENHDGKISPQEWRGLIGAFSEDPQRFDRWFRPLAEAIWELCDRDGDGQVDREEFTCFQKAVGTPPQNREIAFDMLDRDGSGWLSVDELLEAYRDYYTSRDPRALGNWLYGDVWAADVWDGTSVRL